MEERGEVGMGGVRSKQLDMGVEDGNPNLLPEPKADSERVRKEEG